MGEENQWRAHAIGFSSMEEILTWMADQEIESVKQALDEQWRIDWGAYVLRILDELWIFGEVYTQEKFMEVEEIDEGVLDDEATYELDALRDAHTRGYRYGRWFSELVPEGEYGSAHVVALWEISRTDFEDARRRSWRPSPELAFRVGQEVGEAYKRRESK